MWVQVGLVAAAQTAQADDPQGAQVLLRPVWVFRQQGAQTTGKNVLLGESESVSFVNILRRLNLLEECIIFWLKLILEGIKYFSLNFFIFHY